MHEVSVWLSALILSLVYCRHDSIRTERHSSCDITDQQASHGSCEAADSYHARLHHQFLASNSHFERVRGKLLDYVFLVHQPRRQLLHLPGCEQGIQERDESNNKSRTGGTATWKLAENISAAIN